MWHKYRQQFQRWRGILGITTLIAVGVSGVGSTGVFQALEWAIFDRYIVLRPPEPTDSRVVIVTIDESDLAQVGQWPIPDTVLAKLIETIQRQQPRGIGLDLYRDLPVEPGHQSLVELFESTPNLIGVEKLVGDKVAPPPTLKRLEQVALADVVVDADGKVRRGLISAKSSEEIHFSLGARLALMYLEAEGITPQEVNATKTQKVKLGKATLTPFRPNDGGYVRADAGGYQILLNYRGTAENFLTISMTEVLENRIPKDWSSDDFGDAFTGRIVLIGSIAPSLKDLFFTPYSSSFLGSPQQTPGVFIHANLTSQILSAALNGRVLIQTPSQQVELFLIAVWSFVGAAGSWTLLQSQQFNPNLYLRWRLLAVGSLLAGSLTLVGSYLAFVIQGWWLPVASPLLALIGSTLFVAAYYSRELQRDSERKLIQFLEAVPVGIAVVDAQGRPYYFNQRAKQLIGKEVKRTIKVEQIPEIYRFYVAGTNQLYPADKLSLTRALKGENATIDNLEIHQGTTRIPVETRGIPVYDQAGNITFAVVAIQDITERKEAELQRRALTAQLIELNRAYQRFVPEEFFQLLDKKSILNVQLGDAVQKEMSILFADIRAFTTISEMMSLKDNFQFINAFLSRMEPAIIENYGFIDKYIGDAIMALFSRKADDAVRAAISMLHRLADYNITRQRPDRLPLEIGIGINTGSLMLGTVGGHRRMDGTVISDAVNLTARLEKLTKIYRVPLLISHSTFLQLDDPNSYAFRLIDRVTVKGKSIAVSIYEVFDADPSSLRRGKILTKTTFEQALMLYYLKDFQAAYRGFQRCWQRNPRDTVAKIYLQRCYKRLNIINAR